MVNYELCHHGVKGMKWGVKRKLNSVSANRQAKMQTKLANMHEDFKNAHTKKHVSQLSDAELRARINRLQMEAQYSKLAPSHVDKGKAYAQTAMKSLTTVATLTGTALTLYNNIDKISRLVSHE